MDIATDSKFYSDSPYPVVLKRLNFAVKIVGEMLDIRSRLLLRLQV